MKFGFPEELLILMLRGEPKFSLSLINDLALIVNRFP
jgi:hypothetical protein